MVELEILRASDDYGAEPGWEVVAWLRASRDGLEVRGDERMVDRAVPVVSLRTRAQVRFEDDHEEWARNLPSAYRTGDVVVRVVYDDDPLTAAELRGPNVERHVVHLRERAGIGHAV